jgi:hypothetical protein
MKPVTPNQHVFTGQRGEHRAAPRMAISNGTTAGERTAMSAASPDGIHW